MPVPRFLRATPTALLLLAVACGGGPGGLPDQGDLREPDPSLGAPPRTPVVSAPAALTAGQPGYRASVPALQGVAIAWTVANGTITAGADRPEVTFTAGEAGNLGLTCTLIRRGGSRAATLSIPVRPGPVLAAPAVSVLRQGTDTVSTNAVPGASYAWTVTGARILKGQGTPAITLFNGADGPGAGHVTVALAETDPGTGSVGSTRIDLAEVDEDALAPAGLAYEPAAAVLTLGVPMDDLLQDSLGGSIQAYAITPPLPAGLALDPATGFISGTPAALSPATEYTVTATNALGSATAALSIAIVDAPPRDLAYATASAVFTRGTAIAPDRPASAGGAVTRYAVVPDLPAGLSLDPATGIVSGTPATASPATTYTVTATNSGGSARTTLAFTVLDPPRPTLAYGTAEVTCTRTVAVTPIVPVAAFAAGATYSVAPPLPQGLALDAATGIISGTPATLRPATAHVVTLATPFASAQATLTFTVNDLRPANLTYSQRTPVYTRGVAITRNRPAASGGAPVSYAVSPALPAGLALDAATGVLLGTPTDLVPAAPYTVTATNTGGSAQAVLVLTVADPPPAGLTYTYVSATFFRGQAIAVDAPSSGGGAVVSYAVAPALPAGLDLDPATGIIKGTPAAVTPLGTYTVTASNSGGSATAALSFEVVAAGPAIVSDPAGLSVFAGRRAKFTVAAAGSGPLAYQWTKNGAPIPGATGETYVAPPAAAGDDGANFAAEVTDVHGNSAISAAAVLTVTHPYPRLAFVANGTDGTVSAFAVDAVSGQLRHRGHWAAGAEPTALAVDAGGSFLYAVDADSASLHGSVKVFAITPAGALDALDSVDAGRNPGSIVLEYSGRFAYVLNRGDGTVSAYAAGPGGGLAPVPGSPFAAGSSPACAAADPTGTFVLVADAGDATLKTFRIDAGTGALAPAGSAPLGGAAPVALAFDPAGGFVLVADSGDATLKVFGIDPGTGALTPAGSSPLSGPAPGALAFDPSGAFVYVADASNGSVETFAFGAGTLTALGTPATAGEGPSCVTVDPSGAFVYVTNALGHSISGFARDASTGALAPAGRGLAGRADGAGAVIRGRANGRAIAVVPGGTAAVWRPAFAYAADPATGTIAGYAVDAATGLLSALPGMPATAGLKPTGIAISPEGTTAFVANSGSTGGVDSISAFGIEDGAFTPQAPSAVGTSPMTILLDPTGRFAVTSHKTSPDLRVCRVTGANLTGTGSATAPGAAPVIAFDPAGRYVFAAAAGTVAAFGLDAAGNVSQPPSGASLPAGPKPKAICVDPSGRYLYVSNSGLPTGGDAIWAYAIDPATGGLTALGVRSLSPSSDGILSLAMDPLGRFLFAGCYGLGSTAPIHRLAIGADGSLTDLGNTPDPPGPGNKFLAVDPSGRFLLFLSSGADQQLTTFAIAPSTGALTRAGSALPAPGSPLDSGVPTPTALVVTGTVR